MRPLIKIDAAHLKWRHLGTNLLAVGMDANNQIIPLATGVAQGETVESWSWFVSKLKECIGDRDGLVIISDRHYAITIACKTVFPEPFMGIAVAIWWWTANWKLESTRQSFGRHVKRTLYLIFETQYLRYKCYDLKPTENLRKLVLIGGQEHTVLQNNTITLHQTS